MDDNTAETREETITALTAALAELEGGEGLSRFVGGHGFMSRRFEFAWREPTLEIDFSLPYARVLADEGGAGYSILDGQGELVDSGDGWAGLVHRLESALPEGEGDLSVIWP